MNPNLKAGPGRPKGSKNKAPIGLAEYIREKTRNGEELVDLYVSIARGTKLDGTKRAPTTQDRAYAAGWLVDRAFGRPKQSVDIGTTEAMAELLQLALGIKR